MPSLLYALSALVLTASNTDAFVSSPRALSPSYTASRINTHARCRNSNSASASSLSMHGGQHLSAERKAELVATATAMSQSGKGLTACDEGPGTIGDRFEKVGIENTEENRRLYRQMLFTVANGDQFLSGAILDPETVYQKTDDGVPFPELLTSRGIVPGVKPHLKVYELPGCKPGETVMQGLDSLAVRCKEYYAAGCRFAKWRSPLVIGADGDISALAIQTNMDDLARYALICQDEGLVPIVEPDISLNGDYDLETAIRVNVKVQAHLYKAMLDHGVFMEGSTLKPNMVNPGRGCKSKFTAKEIGEATVTALRRVMPAAMPGVNFLSGGQTLEDAAARLCAINQFHPGRLPYLHTTLSIIMRSGGSRKACSGQSVYVSGFRIVQDSGKESHYEYGAKGNSPWNLSFSWSQALQLPLLDLCKKNPKGSDLPLAEMSALLEKELVIAGAAARGEYEYEAGQGDHN